MKIIGGVALAGLLALSGCASNRVELVERGLRPNLNAPAALTVAAAPNEGPPVDSLMRELQRAGLVAEAEAGNSYVLEASYGERPVKVGAYSGPPPAEDAAAGGWIAPPGKPPFWRPLQRRVCTLSIRIADAARAGETYELRAVQKGRGEGCGDAATALPEVITARLASG